MGQQVTLTLAGDSAKLEKAFDNTQSAVTKATVTVTDSSSKMDKAMGKLNGSAVFLTEGIAGLGDTMATLTNLQNDAAVRADALGRAELDVAQAAQDYEQALGDARQATLDLAQSQVDSVQAGIDVEQATLDAKVATEEYAAALAEHGAGSNEATQAAIDLKQANADVTQAQLDAKQATEDGNQALIDNKQATLDANGAQLALHETQRAAVPPSQLAVWTERLSSMAPLLFTVIGATQLFTGASWALNFAWLASPITWIVLAIVALIAVVVLIATKTTWFQDIWRVAWGGIKSAASAVWDWLSALPGKLGNVFHSVQDAISAPFKAAFNMVSRAWNNTIGRLSWTMPSIFGVGGFTIRAPQLPTFHGGGTVPGPPGQDVLAVLQGGERVQTRAQAAASDRAGGGTTNIFVTVSLEDLKQLQDLEEFLDLLRNSSRRGMETRR